MAISHASKGLKRDKSVGTFVGILKIEKPRIACGKGYRLLFDSRRPWILYECLLCAKRGHSRLEGVFSYFPKLIQRSK